MKKELTTYNSFYFIGIGGIGMSALARYWNQQKIKVQGYDSTRTELTQQLEKEGIKIHHNDLGEAVLDLVDSKTETLIVVTPAVSKKLQEMSVLSKQGYEIIKRSELLGEITKETNCLAVAGTHGKTTTSCLLAYVLTQSSVKCDAFLGGVSTNYDTNFITKKNAKYTVVEADEFDRSFLHLNPNGSILTSIEADHLDIFKNDESIKKAFADYVKKIHPQGFLVKHASIPINHDANTISYAVERKNADYFAENLRFENGKFLFDVEGKINWKNIELGIPGVHNVENALAVIAMCLEVGLDEKTIRTGLSTFKGVKRRFETVYKSQKIVYIDDYAHHPTAIKQLVLSVKLMYPNKKLTVIFQPHLYSRTQDFMDEFAQELSKVDEVILLPIYPAREEPIEGVTSEVLLDKIQADAKTLEDFDTVLDSICAIEGVLLTVGAGNISNLVSPLKAKLSE